MALPWVFGIEGGLVFKHGTGDGDEPVGDGSQGTGMALAAGTEGGVFGTAGWVALHGDARPVVDGVAQAVVRGEAADNDHALARAPGDRGGAAQAAQGMAVPAPQRIEGFCEQRGEDDPADSGTMGPIAPSGWPCALRAPGQPEGACQRPSNTECMGEQVQGGGHSKNLSDCGLDKSSHIQ